MGPTERRKRALELKVDDSEFHQPLDGNWYRRGPACPTCRQEGTQGVDFSGVEQDGREMCAVCETAIDVAAYGPKQTGLIKVLFPPDTDDHSRNPYLNPIVDRNMPIDGLRPVEDADRLEYEYRSAFIAAGIGDVGNGRRLAQMFGKRLRYTAGWGWLVFDGRRWLRDDIGTVHRLAKATLEEALAILESARADFWENVTGDYGIAKSEFLKEVRGSFSAGKIDAMIRMAQSESNVVARSDDFDKDTWLLCCKNGIVDLLSGDLRPHDPELYISQLVPHDYPTPGNGVGGDCPRWERFIDEMTCGDKELADLLQRLVGYTLTGEVREQLLVFMYGDGANGKTTFLEVIRHVLGDYGTSLSFEALLKSRNSTPEQGFAHLPGKRFATSVEVGESRAWNEEAVKTITGGDTMRGKFLYKDTFEFQPQVKIWVAANERPRIDGVNEGIWRRFLMVPCAASFTGDQKDEDLKDKLRAEAPGILAWAVRGAQRFYREGIKRKLPDCVTDAVTDYRESNDALGRFIADCCELGPDLSASASDLVKAQKKWSEEMGERALTQTALGTRLHKWAGGKLRKGRMPGGRIRWEGIGLKINLQRDDEFHSGLRKYDRP